LFYRQPHTIALGGIQFQAPMQEAIEFESRLLLILALSIFIPIVLYGLMMWKKSISRKTVVLLALVLLSTAGLDIFLLRKLSLMAERSPVVSNSYFLSNEVSIALYLLPALFAGIGINMLSHILVSHLAEAETKFDEEHKAD
jgi:hypothetical protein